MTKNFKRFQVEKLIRDKIPEIMKTQGMIVNERVMEQAEFEKRLKEKLLEEAQEVHDTDSSEELIEELADILEVIYALAQAGGISLDKINEKRLSKRESKGGFDARIYNHYVDIEDDNPHMAHFTNKQKQYPQIKKGIEHAER